MACYGVQTDSIERLSALMRDFPERQVLELEPEQLEDFARRHAALLREIERQFLAAFGAFLQVLLAIARTRLELGEQTTAQEYREFRRPFLEIYARSANESLAALAQVLDESFVRMPSLRVSFASQLASSAVAEEMTVLTRGVNTAETASETESHGGAAKEVTDSVKTFIKEFVKQIPFVRRLKKKKVELGLHVINEVIGIVFFGR